jgi:hypothetical protein
MREIDIWSEISDVEVGAVEFSETLFVVKTFCQSELVGSSTLSPALNVLERICCPAVFFLPKTNTANTTKETVSRSKLKTFLLGIVMPKL